MRAGARGKADTRSALDAFVFRFRVHDDATVRLIWHLDFGCPAREISETAHAREALMTIRRMLPAFLAAAFVLATDPAQAEMKNQWVEYSHGDTKLKAYMVYDDQVAGQRPAVLMIHAREGMTAKTLG